MVARTTSCDAERLRELLDGTLADAEQTVTMRHLETCSFCQKSLESLAAEPQWWNEAGSSLRCVAGSSKSEEISRRPSGTGTPDEDSFGACQFVRHYLAPPEKPEHVGRLGEYEITEIIGRGGMGIVLKGFDASLNRYVAIKLLSPELASSAAARQRFAREAQAAAAVVHGHVVPIHSVSGEGDLPYLVMPFIGGESLQRRIDRQGSLPLREVLRVAMQAARGLGAAHEQGLVHRDIKPANILLEKDVDRVLLTDFGLARAVDDATLTVSGVVAGTPQYMSPEQARGEAVDRRSDLFSLGSVMYAMCTGRPPFRAETTMGILHRITTDTPRPVRELNPDVPEWLAGIIDRLLAKDPDQRYASAVELAELLGQCLAHVQHPTAIKLPSAVMPPKARPSRRRLVLMMLAAVLMVGSATVYWLREPPAAPTKPTWSPADLQWQPTWSEELNEIDRETRALLEVLKSGE